MCIPALKEGCITSTFLLCCLWLCKVKLIHSIHNLDVSLIFLHHKYFILFFFISAEAVTACRTFLAQMQGPATDQMRGAVRAYSRWYVTQCTILGFRIVSCRFEGSFLLSPLPTALSDVSLLFL